MSLRTLKQTLSTELQRAVQRICQAYLPYPNSYCVEGLLGVTMDSGQVFLVNVNYKSRKPCMKANADSSSGRRSKRPLTATSPSADMTLHIKTEKESPSKMQKFDPGIQSQGALESNNVTQKNSNCAGSVRETTYTVNDSSRSDKVAQSAESDVSQSIPLGHVHVIQPTTEQSGQSGDEHRVTTPLSKDGELQMRERAGDFECDFDTELSLTIDTDAEQSPQPASSMVVNQGIDPADKEWKPSRSVAATQVAGQGSVRPQRSRRRHSFNRHTTRNQGAARSGQGSGSLQGRGQKDRNHEAFWEEYSAVYMACKYAAENPQWTIPQIIWQVQHADNHGGGITVTRFQHYLGRFVYNVSDSRVYQRNTMTGDADRVCVTEEELISLIKDAHATSHASSKAIYELLRVTYYPCNQRKFHDILAMHVLPYCRQCEGRTKHVASVPEEVRHDSSIQDRELP